MRSHVTRGFRRQFERLPSEVQTQARKSYALWKENPRHPGLQFKTVHQSEPIYSVRVGRGWRAVGALESGGMVWFWIGDHKQYSALLKQL